MTPRGIVPVLTVITLVVSLTSAMAAASGREPGWRPVATLGPANGVTRVENFVATGARDAWSIFGGCGPCNGPHPTRATWLEHWTGRAWRRVSVPPSVTKLLKSAGGIQTGTGLGASSADDLWVVSISLGKAAHWNGKHWGIFKLPAWLGGRNQPGPVDVSICDFGPSDLWVFGAGILPTTKQQNFAARFDGHHWIKQRLPGVVFFANGFGQNDIWTLAESVTPKAGQSVIMHWNGRSWAQAALPKPSGVPAGYHAQLEGFAPTGPSDVWLQQDIAKGDGIQRVDFLWHWNGRTWTRVRYGFFPDDIAAIASDGHGGLWIADVLATKAQTRFLVHYRAGRWSRQLVPVPKGSTIQQVAALTQIPGTQSLWAAGDVSTHSNDFLLGEIWKFGR